MLAVVLALALVVPPAPAARVNDYAGLLTAAERGALEQRLAERERATGAQMVVAVFPSLEGESLEDFSIRLAERWRIGRKGLDNGVILLVFVRERRLRLEVGYGLEPVLPDLVAGQIIRDVIRPRFREGRWAEGLGAAVDAVYARVGGGPPPPPRAWWPGGPAALTLGFVALLVVVAVVLAREAFGTSRRARRHVYSLGGRRWHSPAGLVWSPTWGGDVSGGGFSGGDGFSGGGGGFGGGGASGDW